jgi:hypothetical protein
MVATMMFAMSTSNGRTATKFDAMGGPSRLVNIVIVRTTPLPLAVQEQQVFKSVPMMLIVAARCKKTQLSTSTYHRTLRFDWLLQC